MELTVNESYEIPTGVALDIIAMLLSDEGENGEYDRACSEIAVDLIACSADVSMEDKDEVRALLRQRREAIFR
jgi:hypothetical protein